MFTNKSTQMFTIKAKAQVAKKPFCKVCKDAGKSEEVYTSHFLRDKIGPNSKIICPTLLALECQYCHEKGHTVSYCKKLKAAQKFHKRKDYNLNDTKRNKVAAATGANSTFKNKFSVFDIQSDSEEMEDEVVTDEITPVDFKEMNLPQYGVSYAAMASKPQTVYARENEAVVIPMALEEVEEGPPNSPPNSPPSTYAKIHPIPYKQSQMRSWADWESSDDEEEDEDTSGYVDNTAW